MLAKLKSRVLATMLPALLAFWSIAHAQVIEIDEVISREVGIHVGGISTPDIQEIVSRESSIFIENGRADGEVISREISVVTDAAGAPPQVTGYTVTPSADGGTVLLNWSNYNPWQVADVDHFKIYVSSQPFSDVASLTPFLIVRGETVTATLSGLPLFQDHYISIVAVDALQNANPAVVYSAAYILTKEIISREISVAFNAEPVPPYREVVSREVSVVRDNPGAPASVVDFSVTTSPIGDTATLNWSSYNQWAQYDVAKFRIYYSDTFFTSLTGVPFVDVPGESVTHTFTGLTPWVDHYFAIVPVDALGASDPIFNYGAAYVLMPEVVSHEVAVFMGAEPTPPYREIVSRETSVVRPDATTPAPVTFAGSGFTATTARTTYGGIALDWRSYNEWAQQDVFRYRIYVSASLFSDVTGMTPHIFSNDGTQISTIRSGSTLATQLTPETIYYVAVVAEDVQGNFNPAVYPVSAKTAVGELGPVANLTAVPTPTTITFAWDLGGVGDELADFVKEFRVYLDGSLTPIVIAPASRTWTAIDLMPETTHAVRITTVDLNDLPSAGVTATATTLPIPPGTVEPGFNADVNGVVYTVASQPDGKMLIGGDFTNVSGVTRNRLARLNADGTLDLSFNPSLSDYAICFYVQGDGKILVGGNFTTAGGVGRNRLARLHADGTLDTAFNPNANSLVRSIVVQADGKIVLCGDFTSMSGVGRNRIARLNANGTLDSTFNPNANSSVFSTQLHPDGKLVLCGPFTSIGGVSRNRIARLEANGALDLSFNPNASAEVYFSMPLSNGKILLGGTFTTIGGISRNRIAMINSDGSLVSTFNPGASSTVVTASQQANGQIIVGGAFTTFGGVARNRIARFDMAGTLDSNFNPSVNDTVCNVSLRDDGKVIVAGVFTTAGGLTKNRLALLSNDPISQTLTVSSAQRIDWLRGGTLQESTDVFFDISNDSGATWTALGVGSRINGGWELNNLALPNSGRIRASARLVGGYLQSTSGLQQTSTSYSFMTPLQVWKQTYLENSNAPDLDDPDFDGLATLVEYALGTLPHVASGSPLTGTRFAYPEGERLRIFVLRDPARNDITVEVLAAANLSGPWTIIATSQLGSPFTGSGYFAGDSATLGLKSVEIRDTVNIADAPLRFMRVRVTSPSVPSP